MKKAKYNVVDKGNKLSIDVSFIDDELKNIEKSKGIDLSYVFNLLEKYY